MERAGGSLGRALTLGPGAPSSSSATESDADGGQKFALIDAYGPGNARGSSGGQSRVIRMGYGDQEIYSRWSLRSLEQWKALLRETGLATQFQPSGVLWMARGEDPLTAATLATLGRLGVRHELLRRPELEARWPQIDFGPITWAIHEPESGVLVGFHAVQAVVQRAMASGVEYLPEAADAPSGKGGLSWVRLRSGKTLRAGNFVFACGPWLPRLFPELLGERIFPTRQEVFYFGPPARRGALQADRDAGLGGLRRGDLRPAGLEGTRLMVTTCWRAPVSVAPRAHADAGRRSGSWGIPVIVLAAGRY